MQLRDLLVGGDRRSIAQANRAFAIARDDQEAVAELARLTGDSDWLVGQRACDALEKLAHEKPDWVDPCKQVFIDHIDSPYWEVRLQCVRAIPLFEWTADEKQNIVCALRPRLEDEQKFVRAWALDAFATIAGANSELRVELMSHLDGFLGSGVASLRARARAIAKRLTW